MWQNTDRQYAVGIVLLCNNVKDVQNLYFYVLPIIVYDFVVKFAKNAVLNACIPNEFKRAFLESNNWGKCLLIRAERTKFC